MLLTAVLFFACTNDQAGVAEHSAHDSVQAVKVKDTSKKSIPSEVKGFVGGTEIKINYNAPAVRGRVIWGGLVPYDQVWVTGAHKATLLHVGKSFKVGEKIIPQGKYALFTIPGKEEWIVIINKNWNQHLADDYSEAEDVVRLTVKPTTLEQSAERLKYEIRKKTDRLAAIVISWEKLSISFDIEVL